MTQREELELKNKVADLESAMKALLGGLGKLKAGKPAVAPLDTREPKVPELDLTGRVQDLSQRLIDLQSQIENLENFRARTEEVLREIGERVNVDAMGGAPAKGANFERDGDLTSAIKTAHANGQRGGRGLGHPIRS